MQAPGNATSQFKKAITRESAATEYAGSDRFYTRLKDAVLREIITQGETRVGVEVSFNFAKSHAPLIQPTFNRLKEEFPQLNHFRTYGDFVVLDTKESTFLRRLGAGGKPGVAF